MKALYIKGFFILGESLVGKYGTRRRSHEDHRALRPFDRGSTLCCQKKQRLPSLYERKLAAL
jgi:hypothetical protein